MGKGGVAAPNAVFCEPTPDYALGLRVRELLAAKGYYPTSFSGVLVPNYPRTSLDNDYDTAFKGAQLLILWFPSGKADVSWARYIKRWAGATPTLVYIEAGGAGAEEVAAITNTAPTPVANAEELLDRVKRDIPAPLTRT